MKKTLLLISIFYFLFASGCEYFYQTSEAKYLIVYKNGGDNNIYTVYNDGSNLRQLTSTGTANYPKFSPNGNIIIFKDNANYKYLDLNGNSSFIRKQDASYITEEYCSWSPDGLKIVFADIVGNLYIYKQSDKSYKTIYSGFIFDSVDFTPDGQKIITSAGTTFYSINADGTNLKTIITGMNYLKYHPSGTRLGFVNAGNNLFICDTDINNKIQLTSDGKSDYFVFSPDGTKIFYINSGPPIKIWSMDIDGNNKREIPNTDDVEDFDVTVQY